MCDNRGQEPAQYLIRQVHRVLFMATRMVRLHRLQALTCQNCANIATDSGRLHFGQVIGDRNRPEDNVSAIETALATCILDKRLAIETARGTMYWR